MFVDLPRLVRAVRCQGARGAEACGREAGVREKVLESLCGGAGGQPNDVDTVSGGLLEGVSWGPGGRYKVFTMLFWLDWKRKSVWGEEERSKSTPRGSTRTTYKRATAWTTATPHPSPRQSGWTRTHSPTAGSSNTTLPPSAASTCTPPPPALSPQTDVESTATLSPRTPSPNGRTRG